MRNLVPIGRFAVIARLSVKALRHYDELGLLRPALVDAATGYRYYSAAQATDAERIRLLRALEVPLDEIAAILRERDAAALRARLERHRVRLEARVEEDCRRIAALVRLSEEEKPMTHDIALRAIEAQPVLGRRERAPLASLGAAAGRAFGEIYGYLGAMGARPRARRSPSTTRRPTRETSWTSSGASLPSACSPAGPARGPRAAGRDRGVRAARGPVRRGGPVLRRSHRVDPGARPRGGGAAARGLPRRAGAGRGGNGPANRSPMASACRSIQSRSLKSRSGVRKSPH